MENCISCSGKLKKIGSNQGYNIYRCNLCGLGKTSGKKITYKNYHRDNIYIKAENQFRNIFTKRANLIEKYKKTGSILDIGSSTGLMLSIFKDRGWKVLGIEPSKTSVQYAVLSGIATLNTTFPSPKLKNKSFDAIILNHVLEHIKDPLEFLKNANLVLKNNGVILVDLPNFGSLAAKLSGASWRYILPYEHVWHFTPKGLSNILEKVGCKVIYKETHSGIWEYGNPLQEITESLFGLKKRFLVEFLTFIPTWFLSKLGLGTGITVIAKKS